MFWQFLRNGRVVTIWYTCHDTFFNDKIKLCFVKKKYQIFNFSERCTYKTSLSFPLFQNIRGKFSTSQLYLDTSRHFERQGKLLRVALNFWSQAPRTTPQTAKLGSDYLLNCHLLLLFLFLFFKNVFFFWTGSCSHITQERSQTFLFPSAEIRGARPTPHNYYCWGGGSCCVVQAGLEFFVGQLLAFEISGVCTTHSAQTLISFETLWGVKSLKTEEHPQMDRLTWENLNWTRSPMAWGIVQNLLVAFRCVSFGQESP